MNLTLQYSILSPAKFIQSKSRTDQNSAINKVSLSNDTSGFFISLCVYQNLLIILLLKIKSYLFLLFLMCCSLAAMADRRTAIDREFRDSLMQTIRLRVHLVVTPKQLKTGLSDTILRKNIPIALFSPEEINAEIAKHFTSKNPLVQFAERNIPDQNELLSEIIRIDANSFDRVKTSDNLELIQEQLSTRQFVYLIVDTDSFPSFDYFIRFWEQTGKLPNFIQIPDNRIDEASQVIEKLNLHPKIFGLVRQGDQLLSKVSWKDFPKRKTNGYFSFPISPELNSALTPFKAGFQFSPDIILPSPENLGNLKIFNAMSLASDFGLTDHLVFSNRIQNLIRKNKDEIIDYGLEYVKDQTRGNCAFFSGKTYLDCGLTSRSALKANFSLTAWIKPVKLGSNNCILGKGKDFVLKIHDGLLTFTVQGIKDYFSAKTKIPLNQWSFIGLVHSASEHTISFYLNGELTETISLLTPYAESEYTMLIGNNLWEEFFIGYIQEIKIWNRELNDEQIRYEFQIEKKNGMPVYFLWISAIFVLAGLWVFVRYNRKRQRIQANRNVNALTSVIPEQRVRFVASAQNKTEQIQCFGGLKIITSDGNDISQKFSPKLKQLFVLILLHSLGNEKGISSQKMSDFIWPGMSAPKTKNIRGTNIQNLKSLLASCSGMKLVFQDKLWKLEFADGYFVDLGYVNEKLSQLSGENKIADAKSELPDLLPILKKGTLLPDMKESWVDPFVDQMSSRIIEFCQHLLVSISDEKSDGLLLDLAEVISINDPLNENALSKKIEILIRQGKLSLAHTAYDNFTKLYFELYQEKYPVDFKSLIDRENIQAE